MRGGLYVEMASFFVSRTVVGLNTATRRIGSPLLSFSFNVIKRVFPTTGYDAIVTNHFQP